MPFQVVVDRNVIRNAKKYLKESQRKKLSEFLRVLEHNPFPKPPFDVKPVKGTKSRHTNTYRFRIGDYRLFYAVYWEEKVIVVTDLRPRESAYR